MRHTLIEKEQTKPILISRLTRLLESDIRIDRQFPKHGLVNVRTSHPFALVQEAISQKKAFPANIFPSISVSITTESTAAKDIIGRGDKRGLFTQDMLNVYRNSEPETRLYTAEALQDIQNTIDANIPIRYEVFEFILTGRIVLSVWSENDDLTDYIYQIVRTFVTTESESLLNRQVGWENITYNGDRDGMYNFDFGRTLYGSSITLSGDRIDRQTVVTDENIENITDITTPITGVNAPQDGSDYTAL